MIKIYVPNNCYVAAWNQPKWNTKSFILGCCNIFKFSKVYRCNNCNN